MTRLVNLTDIAQQVEIYTAEGTKTTIRVMPKRRVDIAEGQRVVPNWMALNPKAIKIFSNDELAPAPKVPTTQPVEPVSGE